MPRLSSDGSLKSYVILFLIIYGIVALLLSIGSGMVEIGLVYGLIIACIAFILIIVFFRGG